MDTRLYVNGVLAVSRLEVRVGRMERLVRENQKTGTSSGPTADDLKLARNELARAKQWLAGVASIR